jgi:hypothetical protein
MDEGVSIFETAGNNRASTDTSASLDIADIQLDQSSSSFKAIIPHQQPKLDQSRGI